ncbi:MAG: hypothetical protein A2Y53_07490 [Chloroflexi bacterium RBG_16_47_49]|nr:MAG: hypothetical protein A2Y53_07490 [Chloroflexi bacterium RBG_16_47_49]
MFGITLPGTVAGINLVGWLALRWVWKDIPPRTRQRLICSTVSVLIFMVIPALIFLVLVPITDIWDADLFYLLLIALVQFGPLVAGLVGYHRPWLAHDPN